MPDMFGMPAGFIAADEQARQNQAARDEHELRQQQIQSNRLVQEQRARMAQLLQKDQGKPGEGSTDTIMRIARLALQAGDYNQGMELLGHAAAAQHAEAITGAVTAKQKVADVAEAERLLSEVTDEDSYHRANAAFRLIEGRPSPFEDIPYSPENLKILKGAMMQEKSAAQAELARARADEIRATTDAKKEALKAKADADRRRADKVGKAGGSSRAPNPSQIRAITDILQGEFTGMTPEEQRTVARPIAERVQDILAEHPGKKASEAVAQAMGEAEQEGTFDDYKRRPKRHKGAGKATSGDVSAPPPGFVVD